MKIKSKVIFFVALLSLFYSINLIQTTYAKYVSSASANTNITMGRWNILVNGQDIRNNSNFTNTITPIFNGTEYIKEGVIAPTSKGYFDIIINGTNTDVSFKYTLNVSRSSNCVVEDLKITSYELNGIEYAYQNNQFSNIINYDDTNKIYSYRFYIEWDDGINQTMNNSQDTQASNSENVSFDINLNTIQMH